MARPSTSSNAARVALLLALAGCAASPAGPKPTTAPAPSPSPAISGPPLVELGGGVNSFEPLVDGQEVDIVLGAQGGYHIWASVRSRNLVPAEATIDYTIYDAETKEKLSLLNRSYVTLAAKDGYYVWYGIAGFLCDRLADCKAALDKVNGRRVIMELKVTDTKGASATDARTVQAVWREKRDASTPGA